MSAGIQAKAASGKCADLFDDRVQPISNGVVLQDNNLIFDEKLVHGIQDWDTGLVSCTKDEGDGALSNSLSLQQLRPLRSVFTGNNVLLDSKTGSDAVSQR
jgi:hypothetical protein